MHSGNYTKEDLSIKHMKKAEVNVAIDWAQKEGWNPGIHDAECFFQADPDGFYAAKIADEIVGTVSAVKYSSNFAFEGLMIVKSEFRQKGVGSAMQAFVNDLCRNVNLGLDGVLQMQEKYERVGFNYVHKNTRYAGVVKETSSGDCLSIQKADFADVAAFDSKFFPAPRPRFLEGWLFQKDASAMLAREKQSDAVCGYGVIRKCFSGHKIGPLFAVDPVVAESLFNDLVVSVNGEKVFLDLPEPNTAAVELANRQGMMPVFSTVRMYTKQEPKLPLDKIYGVTSFELG
ncbi:MAG: GNAT family N-acetyltransferase [Candidatus Bathyarchaeota archaeon]|nr:GNAT family N-acetyltransferase [Candidatus Bathyarchaeota archaeon]